MKFAIIYPVPFLDSVPIVQSLAVILANEGHLVDLFVVGPGNAHNTPHIDHCNVTIHQYQKESATKDNKLFNITPRNFLFYLWIRSHVCDSKYDHIIGVDPSGLAMAGFVCYFKKFKFSYLSLELILWEDKNRMFRGYKLLESFFIKKATRIIIQDELRLELLRTEYGLRSDQFELFPNSPIGDGDCTKSNWLHNKLKLSHDTKIVLYMGSWSDEFNKNWIVDLANRKIGNTVIVVQSRRKVDLNSSAKARNIIFFEHPLKYSELKELISSATIGLAFYDVNVSPNIKFVGKSSGKLTHYLFHGVPVICNSLPYWKDSFHKFRSGSCADSSDELYCSVLEMLENSSDYTDGAISHFRNELKVTFSASNFE